jgi:hypothetical protein
MHTSFFCLGEVESISFSNASAVVNVNQALTGAYVYSHKAGYLPDGIRTKESALRAVRKQLYAPDPTFATFIRRTGCTS